MIIVAGGRRSGKTTACVNWLLEDPGRRVLLTCDMNRRSHILRQLQDTLPGVNWNEYVMCIAPGDGVDRWGGPNRYKFAGGRQIGIDDLEEVLMNLFNGRVEFAAANATPLRLALPRKEEPSYYPPDYED